MKLNKKINLGVVFVALALVSAQVSALTLGRLRGSALLGKELDISVLVQLSADEASAPPCYAATVNYGESQVEPGRITVRAQPGPEANTQWVRITSSARIDDAVVSVQLKAACGQQASRRYVLLADVLTDQTSANPQPVLVAAPAPVAAPASNAVPATRATEPAATPPAPVPTKPAASKAAPVKKTDTGSSLKLAPATGAAARQAPSKASNALNAAALEDLQRRVTEVEQWQASSNVAEELKKNDARTTALESNLKDLQAVTAKNLQSLQVVTATLESNASQSFGRELVYTLAALLALCLGGLVYAFARMRGGAHAKPWWSDQAERAVPSAPAPLAVGAPTAAPRASAADVAPAPVPVSVPATPAAGKAVAAQPGAVPASPVHNVDLDIGFEEDGPAAASLPTQALPVAVAVPPAPPAARSDFANSGHASIKAINTKEMLDVRQQAEFFMALGQHDEAVRLLESSIQGSADANPMVYLDLLKIFHTLSRRAEFERYRDEFNQQFTGRVPGYASFLVEGNGLEAYDEICQQIVVLWPTEYTIDFIEQCLVRTPEDDPEQGIDMEAFKDLLLLYGVLKRLDQTLDSTMVPFSASRNAQVPMGTIDGIALPGTASAGQQALEPLPMLSTPGSFAPAAAQGTTADLGVDLDLEIPAAPQEPQHDNLINFDISGFGLPTEPKPPKG